MKSVGKTYLLVVAMAVASAGAAVLGCSSYNEVQSEPNGDMNQAGAVGLRLQVAQGITFNAVNYTLTGPAAFSQNGTIDVSHSTSVLATIGGLPTGSGYTISLTATATDGVTTCAGAGTFNVAARATTTATVRLTCHQPSGTGSLLINGQLNVCPVIDGLSALPLQVSVGSTIALTGAAHDPDAAPAALSYQWSATSGTFSNQTARNPLFTCTVPGTSTVTLTVSDGDTTAGCAATLAASVTCSADASVP